MTEIKNVEVYGLEESVIRSGYPMTIEDIELKHRYVQNDFKRAEKLSKMPAGSGHDVFLRGIIVQFDLKYPQYLSMQLQRYNFIDIISSQSKMHTITKQELNKNNCNKYVDKKIVVILE